MGVIEGLASLKQALPGRAGHRQPVRRQGHRRLDAQVEGPGLAPQGEGASASPSMNLDLWQRIDELVARHKVHVTLVLGHNGHPENEACDRMAVAAYKALMGT